MAGNARVTDVDLRGLPGVVQGVEVRFPPDLKEHELALLATLGVSVVLDPSVRRPPRGSGPSSSQKAMPRAPRSRVYDRVVALLSDGVERSPSEIARRSGCAPEYASVILRRLLDAGQVVKPSRGIYVCR